MNKIDKIISCFCTFLCITLWCGQRNANGQQVKDVRFVFRDNRIVVEYDLKKLPWRHYADVSLYYSIDRGNTLRGPLRMVSGEIGRVEFGGKKQVCWDIFSEHGTMQGELMFEVKAILQNKSYENENMFFLQPSETAGIGVMYARVKRWGWFCGMRTNGRAKLAIDYVSSPDGQIDYMFPNEYYRIGREVKKLRMGMTAGIVYRIAYPLYLRGGLGYGIRKVAWKAVLYSYDDDLKVKDLWLESQGDSYKGIEMELGAMFRYRSFGLSAGFVSIRGDFCEFTGGVGVFF